MLTHLQHFNLSPLLNYLYWLHVCFFYYFNRHIFFGFFMSCELYQAELSFPQSLAYFVVVVYVIIAHCLFETFVPRLKRLFIFEIYYARLVWRQHYFNWVVSFAIFGVSLDRNNFFNKSSWEAVHHTMFLVLFMTVDEHIFTNNFGPVSLILIRSSL